MALVDQREAPCGKFHLAQSSPLMNAGLQSIMMMQQEKEEKEEQESSKTNKNSNSKSGQKPKKPSSSTPQQQHIHQQRVGRRDVKWTLV